MRTKIDRLLTTQPMLMAKDIAKALGTTRTEVNSFLHRNQDRYKHDSQFRWQIIDEDQVIVTLPVGWVTGAAFEDALRESGEILEGACSKVVFFFSAGCKLMIACTARMLALMNQLAHRGKHVSVDFTNSSGTLTYLDRAGFFDLLDNDVGVLPGRPSQSAARLHQGRSETLVEFGRVDPEAANDGLIEQLTNKFVQQATKEYRVAALTVFGELIGNVVEHSETPLAGFAGLQKYRNHIQTVVSDGGVGIARTLRPALKEHYPALHKKFGRASLESDMGLVSEAMKRGEISRSGASHGLGFKCSREQALKFNAQFSVRQDKFCLGFQYRAGRLVKVRRQTGLSILQGTHICFDFYLD